MAEEPTTHESRLVRFKKSWEDSLPYIRAIIPTHISPERVFSIAVTARQRNPALLECSDVSILRGIIVASQLGLDISGIGGKCFLVPYYNSNTKQKEAQVQIGWRGLVELARRTGQIAAIYGREVYEGDEFAYEDGMQQRLIHRPIIDGGDPGKIIGVWAVAVWANGFRQIQVMNRTQIDQVRKSSKSGDGGPWSTHYGQMAIKTVIKRLCKLLPDSVELNRAIEMDDYAEIGEPQPVDFELAPYEPVEAAPAKVTRTEAIKEEIKKRGPGRPPKPRPLEGVPLATAPAPPVTTETDDVPETEDDYGDDDDVEESDE